MSATARLAELGIELPEVVTPLAAGLPLTPGGASKLGTRP